MKYNFEIENLFFNHLNTSRASKIFFQFEIFLKTLKINGAIYEFGVFKGNSLTRLILMRNLLCIKKKIYAFDTFKKIHVKKNDIDYKKYKDFIIQSKNFQPTKEQIYNSLKKRKLSSRVKLIEGNVIKTFKSNKFPRACFVLLDLDLYEPSKYILENIWQKVNKGGVILLDNYKVFKGETKAVNEFIKKKRIKLYKKKRFRNFYYLIKN